MSDAVTTGGGSGDQGTNVSLPEPVQPPAKRGPSHWLVKLRPSLTLTPTYDERQHQLKFDVYFSGAKAAGKWEDDWPILTKDEFVQALKDVADIKIGGHNPDGTHPDTVKE